MYAEKLEVPHRLKRNNGEQGVPLASELDPFALEYRLNIARQSNDTEAYSSAKIDIARQITKAVNRSLWFPEKLPERDDFEDMGIAYPVGLKEITEKQVANCYGYTLVASEILEQSSVEHWIAYGNGHAFILMPVEDNDGQHIYFVDPLLPHLNQYIDSSIRRNNPMKIADEINRQDRSVLMLDTLQFCADLNESVFELAKRHPWLAFDRNKQGYHQDHHDEYFSGSVSEEREKLQQKHRIVVSVYQASVGRKLIADYVDFQLAIANSDFLKASRSLQEISGKYPDIDARNGHNQLRIVIESLCEQGHTQAALSLLEEYFRGLEEVSADSRIFVGKGDCYRSIARLCGSSALATVLIDQAEEEYLRAEAHPRSFKEQVRGKIEKVRKQRRELVSAL